MAHSAYGTGRERGAWWRNRWIRRHTVDRFGPVRQVTPAQVFELAFAAAGPSSRHKSSVALRCRRIVRGRTDKPAAEADRLEHVQALLPGEPKQG